jgi:hypothetical protein
MVRRERWEELRRLAVEEGVPIAELARRFGLDRKTVRRCVREPGWRPYQRPARAGLLLVPHAAYLRQRAPQVGYSAQILFQELHQRRLSGQLRNGQALRSPAPGRPAECRADPRTV